MRSQRVRHDWVTECAHSSAPHLPSADLLPTIQCSESLEGKTFLPCPPQMPICHRVACRDSALYFGHDDLVRFSYSTYTGHITLQVHEFTQVHGARNIVQNQNDLSPLQITHTYSIQKHTNKHLSRLSKYFSDLEELHKCSSLEKKKIVSYLVNKSAFPGWVAPASLSLLFY